MKHIVVNLFRFFIYSNLFIAACALLMINQTCRLLLHTLPGTSFSAFAFFATVCSYSFHWYLTPDYGGHSSRLKWLKENRKIHLIFFITSLACALLFAFFLRDYWFWLLVAAFITFLYSAPKIPHPYFRALRKVALGKTIFLALMWTYVTTILPLQITEQPWQTDFYLFIVSRFTLIYAICILFDFRDRDYDRSIGIRSLITSLSEKSITALFAGSLIVFGISSLLMLRYGHSYIIVIILLIPGIITGLLYPYFTKNFSDMLYYFGVDGLMALSALLMLPLQL